MWTQNGDGPEHNGAQVESMVDCGKGVGERGIGRVRTTNLTLRVSILRKSCFWSSSFDALSKTEERLAGEGRFRSQLLIQV